MNMKNFKLILFFITASLFVACDDAIDITQPSEVPPSRVYETVDDMQLGLNGIYASIPGESQIYFTSLFTDEVALGRANGGQGTDGELAFLLNSNSGDAAGIWLSNYTLINRANWLINGVENVEVSEDETVRYNHILAQARALRAFGHFQLMTYFSEDMKNDSSLGVIIMDFAPDGDEIYVELPRNTTGEVFEFINADLDFADANLSVTDPETGDPFVNPNFYVSKGFVLAFKARMAAYRGQYAAANGFVDQLAYNLTNKTNYPRIWSDELTGGATDEVIFKVNRSNPGGNTTGNFSQFWASVNSTVNGSPFFEVNRALFNLVNNPADVRRFVIVDPTAIIASDYNELNDYDYQQQDVLPVGKYRRTENLELLGDIKVFRYSEMVLIKAEYYASIGDVANAIAQVNRIRAARINTGAQITNPSSYTVQQAWAFILRERRMELAFEGHRYVDLRRLGVLAGQQVDRDPRDCAWNGFCTIPSDDYRFVMPIPRLENAPNSNIQQNPGY
jgi:hypothetical protein